MPEMEPVGPVRLTDVDWSEISGVDHPANKLPGFITLKSEGGRDMTVSAEELQALFATADETLKDVEAIRKSLADTQEGVLGTAPKEVQDAAAEVLKYLDGLLHPSQKEPEPEPSGLKKLLNLLSGTQKDAPSATPADDELSDGDVAKIVAGIGSRGEG